MSQNKVKVPEGLEALLKEFAIAAIIDTSGDDLVSFGESFFKEKKKSQHKKSNSNDGKDSVAQEKPGSFGILRKQSSVRIEKSNLKRRKTVWGEQYNPEEESDSEEMDEVYKSVEKIEDLREIIQKIWLFRGLDEEQIEKVISSMYESKVKADDYVIRQNEGGDNFFIIESGTYEVYVQDKGSSDFPGKFVHSLTDGSFGELALMYNVPRTATVRCSEDGVLWLMDRKSFRRIVMRSTYMKRKRYEELLSKIKVEGVEILKGLEPYVRLNLSDALIPMTFEHGDKVIQEGDEADGMYFIEAGKVKVLKKHPGNDKLIEITRLGSGQFFGELALLNNAPRAASVFTVKKEEDPDYKPLKLAFLERNVFERLLGPCIELMQKSAQNYHQFNQVK